MRLFLLVTLTMCAFAANSVLNRIGVGVLGMDPLDFATIRTAAGAAMLWVLVMWRGGSVPAILSRRRLAGAVSLAVYMLGFSWAYLTLDAGLGALILFGVLQIVVFGWAVFQRESIAPLRWLGAVIALVGLVVLLWPAQSAAVPVAGAVSMTAAGVAWAAYTLLGRGEGDPLAATAGNFLLALPLVGAAMLAAGIGSWPALGVLTAALAGAVTSGLGYALWYRLVPQLPTTLAGIAQLSVPVIAVAAGSALLGEALSARLLTAGVLVLGGIGVSLLARR